jgi:hypothetical protein
MSLQVFRNDYQCRMRIRTCFFNVVQFPCLGTSLCWPIPGTSWRSTSGIAHQSLSHRQLPRITWALQSSHISLLTKQSKSVYLSGNLVVRKLCSANYAQLKEKVCKKKLLPNWGGNIATGNKNAFTGNIKNINIINSTFWKFCLPRDRVCRNSTKLLCSFVPRKIVPKKWTRFFFYFGSLSVGCEIDNSDHWSFANFLLL